jgi:hypothetical protein
MDTSGMARSVAFGCWLLLGRIPYYLPIGTQSVPTSRHSIPGFRFDKHRIHLLPTYSHTRTCRAEIPILHAVAMASSVWRPAGGKKA